MAALAGRRAGFEQPRGIVDSDSGLSACIQLCQEKFYNPGLDVAINPN